MDALHTLGTRWLDQAADRAALWSDYTLHAVIQTFPYAPERGIRTTDWVELVSHISAAKEEDPIQTAERLAMYVKTYRERFQKELSPVQVKENQA